MNSFITTNIRLPEEDYMRLKSEALQKRKSLSAVIREKLSSEVSPRSTDEFEKILHKLELHRKRIGNKLKGVDGVKIIREMRDNAKW